MIHIQLLGKPISTQHAYWHRVLKKGWKNIVIKYLTADAKKLKQQYIEQIRYQYRWEIVETPVLIAIKLIFWDKRKRDWDNYHKLSMDALEWTILKDDSQIINAWVKKFYRKGERGMEILIEDLKDYVGYEDYGYYE